MHSMNAVNIENLTFAYPAREGETARNVLCGLSLKIEKGEFVSLIGSNGSGKSTLSRLINGLLQPTSGSVEVFGCPTSDKNLLFDIRKRVGTVFQNPDNQQVASIVEDDIAFGPENIGMPREKTRERIDYVLKVTDMENFRETEVARLSGGQKQRLLLARALAGDPDILLLDDSSSALDYKTDSKLREEIRLHCADATKIIIAQRISSIMHAEKIMVLENGNVIGMGTHEELMETCPLYREIGESQIGEGLAKEVHA